MEKNKKNYVELTRKVSGDEWNKAIHDAFEKNKKNIKMDGFRPGKVPFDVYVKKNGMESLFLEAADLVISKTYLEALEEAKVIPVVEPKVNIKNVSDKEIEFVFEVITKPELKINKYKDLKIKKDELVVTDEEIDHEIEHLLEHYAELVIKDGKVEDGDTVIIDYKGKLDGVEFEGGSAENYSLVIGSNTFIPGFEEQLIGMNKEETKDINVTFPEDYHAENLKGKDVVFTVTVHEIKTKEARKLDEEFFEDLGMEGVNSEETLKNSIKEHLETHKKEDIENKFIEELMDSISKNTEVEIPDEMVEEEIHRLMHRYEENLKYQGITLDLYYQFTKTTEEDMKKQLEPEAFKNVMYRLILEEIIKLEKIEVSDEELEDEIKKMMEKYNITREDIEKEYQSLENLRYDLQMRKTFDKLSELNEVK
ncbi:MAG: trigger factor [Bacilli bacterium]|nr:trigger factor [Bacilli bacterium]